MKHNAAVSRLSCCLLPSAFCLVLIGGCASGPQPTTKPTSVRERQDQAVKDPFNYSPDAGSTDITGGGLSDFDRQGFNRDLKNVLDP